MLDGDRPLPVVLRVARDFPMARLEDAEVLGQPRPDVREIPPCAGMKAVGQAQRDRAIRHQDPPRLFVEGVRVGQVLEHVTGVEHGRRIVVKRPRLLDIERHVHVGAVRQVAVDPAIQMMFAASEMELHRSCAIAIEHNGRRSAERGGHAATTAFIGLMMNPFFRPGSSRLRRSM